MGRNNLEIAADILEAARCGAVKSLIGHRAYVNAKILRKYLDLLTKSGLITQEGRFFKTTRRGLEFLASFRKINEYLPLKSRIEKTI